MSLRTQAALDFAAFISDAAGFGWPVTVTDPAGAFVAMTGLSTDVSETIDPETGIAVSGRSASVTLAMSALTTAGLGIPKGVTNKTGKPWVVTFDDIEGTAHTFKVTESRPDRAIGAVVCVLEAYNP